ncbi:MAG: Sec-independent protein translocase protein TatB [Hyphomicrobium sp.]|jgi:sec-independent protein translocase protein TatB
MFDITSSKLLILAIVALIVVGPKDLPILLRTVGKYLGVIRRQAAEFRQQFDEAMREAELDQLKKEFENAAREVHATVESGARSVETQVEAASVKPEELKFGTGMPVATPVAEPAHDPRPMQAVSGNAAETSQGEQEPGRGAA